MPQLQPQAEIYQAMMFCVTDMHKQVSGFRDSAEKPAHAQTVATNQTLFSPSPQLRKTDPGYEASEN